jgi:thiamine biosynthesis protein ThiS
MATFKINGEEKEFADDNLPETLSDLLNELGICQPTVVAEIDGEVVEREKFGDTKLKPGQSIELVRFVGGG